MPKSNVASFNALCPRILGKTCKKVQETPSDCYLYWGRTNLYAYRFYNSTDKTSNRSGLANYFHVPIEDVVGIGVGGIARQKHLFFKIRSRLGMQLPDERVLEFMKQERMHGD